MDRIITAIKEMASAAEKTIVAIEEGLQNGDFAHEDDILETLKEERQYLKQARLAINYLHNAFIQSYKFYKEPTKIGCKIKDFPSCPWFRALPKGCNECPFNRPDKSRHE
jgi:hypothetical protein